MSPILYTSGLLAGAGLLLGAAEAPAPDAGYRAHIAQQNADYAAGPHAMLKIQDSVYLDDGQSAVLTGRTGEPASWRWRAAGPGVLALHAEHGRLTVTRKGKPVDPALLATGIPVDAGVDVTGGPTQVSAGVLGWRFFVFNARHPDAAAFRGVDYFPFDAQYVVNASFEPDPALRPAAFATSRGTTKQFFHVGDARFTLQGRTATLAFYADGNDPQHLGEMSAYFTDGLSGHGAYPGGRYLDVELDGPPPAALTLDFNQAFNPNCARSAHFTCPLAQDRLEVAVRAGERDPHAAAVSH